MNKLRQTVYQSFDNQSKYLKLEDIVPHKSYAITINPDNSGLTDIKVLQVYNLLYDHLHEFKGNLKLFTEISTKNQNVHYHGFINWSSYKHIAQFYLSISKIKEWCQFEIDHINEIEQWWIYIVKQQPYVSHICQLNKIPNKIKYKYKG